MFPAGQSSRRDQCTGTGPFVARSLRVWTDTRVMHHVRTTTTTTTLPPQHNTTLPRAGNGDSKRQSVTPGQVPDDRSNVVKRVRLTRKTRPGASSHVIPDPGHPTPRRWKRLRTPSSEGVGGEMGVPRNLFPPLGVG